MTGKNGTLTQAISNAASGLSIGNEVKARLKRSKAEAQRKAYLAELKRIQDHGVYHIARQEYGVIPVAYANARYFSNPSPIKGKPVAESASLLPSQKPANAIKWVQQKMQAYFHEKTEFQDQNATAREIANDFVLQDAKGSLKKRICTEIAMKVKELGRDGLFEDTPYGKSNLTITGRRCKLDTHFDEIKNQVKEEFPRSPIKVAKEIEHTINRYTNAMRAGAIIDCNFYAYRAYQRRTEVHKINSNLQLIHELENASDEISKLHIDVSQIRDNIVTHAETKNPAAYKLPEGESAHKAAIEKRRESIQNAFTWLLEKQKNDITVKELTAQRSILSQKIAGAQDRNDTQSVETLTALQEKISAQLQTATDRQKEHEDKKHEQAPHFDNETNIMAPLARTAYSKQQELVRAELANDGAETGVAHRSNGFKSAKSKYDVAFQNVLDKELMSRDNLKEVINYARISAIKESLENKKKIAKKLEKEENKNHFTNAFNKAVSDQKNEYTGDNQEIKDVIEAAKALDKARGVHSNFESLEKLDEVDPTDNIKCGLKDDNIILQAKIKSIDECQNQYTLQESQNNFAKEYDPLLSTYSNNQPSSPLASHIRHITNLARSEPNANPMLPVLNADTYFDNAAAPAFAQKLQALTQSANDKLYQLDQLERRLQISGSNADHLHQTKADELINELHRDTSEMRTIVGSSENQLILRSQKDILAFSRKLAALEQALITRSNHSVYKKAKTNKKPLVQPIAYDPQAADDLSKNKVSNVVTFTNVGSQHFPKFKPKEVNAPPITEAQLIESVARYKAKHGEDSIQCQIYTNPKTKEREFKIQCHTPAGEQGIAELINDWNQIYKRDEELNQVKNLAETNTTTSMSMQRESESTPAARTTPGAAS